MKNLVPFLFAVAALSMASACRDRDAEHEPAAKAPQRAATRNGEPVVTLDEATQEQAGLVVSLPQATRIPAEVRAYATVLDVLALADVRRNYVGARSRVQAAQAKLQASKAAFERARTLHREEENISTAQLQAADAAFRSDEAAFSAAESEARMIAAGAKQAWGPLIGSAIAEGGPLVGRLIERKDVLLQITVPSGTTLEAPGTAFAELAGRPRVKATFVSQAPRTDPNIQGLSFLYVAPADSGLVPGMNVLVHLPSGKPVSGHVVPGSAVVWWQGKPWVYVRKDARTFALQELRIVQPAPQGGYVVSGLAADAPIVVQGAQMLLSEALRSQIDTGEGK